VERLREKLNSESGASILLALLMFLLCAMVSASVLAAAVSNAGKARSNRVEQQRYLTLSSAIRLVADALEQARYTGKYTVWEWEKIITDNSDPLNPVVETERYFCCEQVPGEYDCGEFTGRLPLGKEMNEVFSQQFSKKIGGGYRGLPGDDAEVEDSIPRTLTITLPEEILEGYRYPSKANPESYQISTEVTVEVKLDHSTRHIMLTAWLGTDPLPETPSPLPDGEGDPDTTQALIAELVLKEDTSPMITYTPEGRKPHPNSEPLPAAGTSAVGNTTVEITAPAETPYSTDPKTQWELSWIKKGAS